MKHETRSLASVTPFPISMALLGKLDKIQQKTPLVRISQLEKVAVEEVCMEEY